MGLLAALAICFAMYFQMPVWLQWGIPIAAIYGVCVIVRRHRQAALGAPMTPAAFEHHCAALLAQQGWNARVTGQSGDQGADVVAEKRGIRIVLQCKLYSGAVGNAAVQEAYAAAAHRGALAAAVVTNAHYTASAQTLAASTGVLLLRYPDLTRADRIFGIV